MKTNHPQCFDPLCKSHSQANMKTKEEIESLVSKLEADYAHVLNGPCADVVVNAPRALMQIEGETKLRALHWVLGTKFVSKLKSNKK